MAVFHWFFMLTPSYYKQHTNLCIKCKNVVYSIKLVIQLCWCGCNVIEFGMKSQRWNMKSELWPVVIMFLFYFRRTNWTISFVHLICVAWNYSGVFVPFHLVPLWTKYHAKWIKTYLKANSNAINPFFIHII